MGVHDFLVQSNGSIVLADFCGSILDGSTAVAATSARYSRPFADQTLNQTQKDDIFALGTVIYEICVGHRLYPEYSDQEVFELFQIAKFPTLSHLPSKLQIVVEKCWRDHYGSSHEIKHDIGWVASPTSPKVHEADICRLRRLAGLLQPFGHSVFCTLSGGTGPNHSWSEAMAVSYPLVTPI